MSRKKKNLFEERVKQGKFTVVFNEILEAAYKSDLTQNELKVFLFIWRKTWGWGKDSEIIRVRDIVKELGLDKSLASIALSGLKNKHFVEELSTNRCQIQMDISKHRIKRKIKPQKKDNSVEELSTNRGQFVEESSTLVGKSSTTKSEDSSKNAHLQSPKDTLKRKKKKTTTRDVVSSLSEEEKSKALNQELEDFGIAYINRVFIDDGWESFSQEAKQEIAQNAIIRLVKRTKIELEDYLKYRKRYIDKKKHARSKIGYFRVMVKEGWVCSKDGQEITPPYLEGLEDRLQDLQKEEGEIA